MGGTARGNRLRTFHALAGNRALMRIVAAYALFTLIEYSVWLGVLVYAYSHGGAAAAGLVATAQLVPAAVAAPFTAAIADRRSPVFLLAGGYLAQAAATAGAKGCVVFAAEPVKDYRDYLDVDDRYSHAHWLYKHNGGVFLPPWARASSG